MRRTKEDAALTRAHLLEAALKCFQEKGYVGTTLDDIAQKAGTTRGAIYWHFGNKAQLFNTMVRERYARAATIFQEAFASGESPLQQLRRFLIRWITYAEEDSDFRAVLASNFHRGFCIRIGDERKFGTLICRNVAAMNPADSPGPNQPKPHATPSRFALFALPTAPTGKSSKRTNIPY